MSGRTGVMLSTPPLVSPIIWTTIATGMPPDKHGVLDFVVDTASGGQEPVRSVDRRGPALWSLFTAQDRAVAVIGWWATWPAEHVRGTIVSDRLAPQLLQRGALDDERVIWPRDAVGRIRSLVTRPEQIGYDDLAGYIPIDRGEYARAHALLTHDGADIYADKVAHLATIAASTRTYAALAVDAIRTDRPDLLAVYVEAVDSVSHLFVRDPSRGPPAIERAYRDADELIARVAGASPPDTLDHRLLGSRFLFPDSRHRGGPVGSCPCAHRVAPAVPHRCRGPRGNARGSSPDGEPRRGRAPEP